MTGKNDRISVFKVGQGGILRGFNEDVPFIVITF